MVKMKTYLSSKGRLAEGNGDPVSDFKLQRLTKKIHLVKDLVDEEGSWGGFDEGEEQWFLFPEKDEGVWGKKGFVLFQRWVLLFCERLFCHLA